ncbi:MAG: CU044_5270 family protein [Actinomycetota bacterium]
MDEVDLLNELARDIDPVDPEARARARRLLEERIRSTGPSIRPPRSAHRRSRPAMLAAALVALLVLLIVAIQVVLPPGSGGPNLAEATLDGLARVAGSGESVVPAPGNYLYVRSDGSIVMTKSDVSLGESWSYSVLVSRETWLASDGAGRILLRYAEPRFVSEADRAAWRSAGSPKLLPPGSRERFKFGPGGLATRDLGVLPKDPSSLAAVIASGEIETGPIAIANDPLGVVTALLGEVPTSPELRSSVFLATAELPGIESLGTLADPSGRVGIGVAIVQSGYRTELIFDSTTSELLSTSVVRVDAEGTPTQVLSELTYEVRAIVPSTHAGTA